MGSAMEAIEKVPIELTVVLGRAKMPVHQLLRMGRGAVIELTAIENEQVEILANKMPVATGDVIVQGDRIAVTVTGKLSNIEE